MEVLTLGQIVDTVNKNLESMNGIRIADANDFHAQVGERTKKVLRQLRVSYLKYNIWRLTSKDDCFDMIADLKIDIIQDGRSKNQIMGKLNKTWYELDEKYRDLTWEKFLKARELEGLMEKLNNMTELAKSLETRVQETLKSIEETKAKIAAMGGETK